MITSTDLIEEQIRVALGEKLRMTQVQILTYQVYLKSQLITFRTIERTGRQQLLIFVVDSSHRTTLRSEVIPLSAGLMQRTHSKDSDLVLVRFDSEPP